MEVCILSMQGVDNYGSVLQAYSLKKLIEDLNNTASFIDISTGSDPELTAECLHIAEKNGLQNVYATSSLVKKAINRVIKMRSQYIFSTFRQNQLNAREIDNNKKYDICVIGSDEVFNCVQDARWGFSPQLYGKVPNAEKVISYAASCGATKAEMLSAKLIEAIRDAMKNIEHLSVRDKNTASFVAEIDGRDPAIHLDPVAVGDFSYELEHVKQNKQLPKDYCIIYSYSRRFSDPLEIERIMSFCKKRSLTPISLFGRQTWVQNYYLTPFELLMAYSNAKFIITDTFHGALFGAKYAKKMAVFLRNSNYNKLNDLAERIGFSNHIVTEIEDLDNKWDMLLDRKSIDKTIEDERRRTIQYLSKSICI